MPKPLWRSFATLGIRPQLGLISNRIRTLTEADCADAPRPECCWFTSLGAQESGPESLWGRSGVAPKGGGRLKGAQESLWSRIPPTNFGHLDVDC